MSEKKIKNPINIKRETWNENKPRFSRTIAVAYVIPIRGSYYHYRKLTRSSHRERFIYAFIMNEIGFRICLKRK